MKAKDLKNLVDEVKTDEQESGDIMKFKQGTEFEGLVARVLKRNEDGTVDVYVGSSYRQGVSADDLEPAND